MLKKIIPVLVAVALTAAFTLPNAQTKASKIGFVNAQKVLECHPDGKGIIAQRKKAEDELMGIVNTSLLQEPAETALFAALQKVKPLADKLFESGDYTASLKSLAALKAPVDDFFDHVMVNVDDVDLKNNRLNLLKKLHVGMNRVADLSKLAS